MLILDTNDTSTLVSVSRFIVGTSCTDTIVWWNCFENPSQQFWVTASWMSTKENVCITSHNSTFISE